VGTSLATKLMQVTKATDATGTSHTEQDKNKQERKKYTIKSYLKHDNNYIVVLNLYKGLCVQYFTRYKNNVQ
jgi:hypothetical protein